MWRGGVEVNITPSLLLPSLPSLSPSSPSSLSLSPPPSQCLHPLVSPLLPGCRQLSHTPLSPPPGTEGGPPLLPPLTSCSHYDLAHVQRLARRFAVKRATGHNPHEYGRGCLTIYYVFEELLEQSSPGVAEGGSGVCVCVCVCAEREMFTL